MTTFIIYPFHVGCSYSQYRIGVLQRPSLPTLLSQDTSCGTIIVPANATSEVFIEYLRSHKCHIFLLIICCRALSSLTNLFFIFQFEDIGPHGTKVIIYNLWLNDEGIYELSFDDDDEVYKTFLMVLYWLCVRYHAYGMKYLEKLYYVIIY